MASTINSSTSNGIVITPDTSGEIELQANGVTKAKVTANGLQDANGASLRGGMYRNLVINGDMQIAQRGTSFTGLTNPDTTVYTLDRFQWREDGATTSVWDVTQDTDAPDGFTTSLKVNCTTAQTSLATGDALSIRQLIEANNLQHIKYGTANAETLTLSFWVKSNKTGTYTLWFYQQDGNKDNSKTYTISSANTWEKKTITLEGNTSDVINNDNGAGLYIGWYLFAGTSFTSGTLNTSWNTPVNANRVSPSQVNLADSTSNYINITGVQLEVGSGASDFEFLPYDVQLARCQRYFRKFGPEANSWNGTMTSASYARFYMPLAPSMRTAPAMSYSGSLTQCVEMVGYAFLSPTSVFTANGSPYHFAINADGMSGGASGRLVQIRTNVLGVTLDSEL